MTPHPLNQNLFGEMPTLELAERLKKNLTDDQLIALSQKHKNKIRANYSS